VSRGGSQRLREWCYGTQDEKGNKRRELDVSTCFGPLLQWILAWWPADQPRLALALDATTLKKSFTVLCISVMYRGCAIFCLLVLSLKTSTLARRAFDASSNPTRIVQCIAFQVLSSASCYQPQRSRQHVEQKESKPWQKRFALKD
jgi:hypothetical protein